jgi:hypothetical protein
MKLPGYAREISSLEYLRIVSDLMQAALEPYGIKVGRPIPDGDDSYRFWIYI